VIRGNYTGFVAIVADREPVICSMAIAAYWDGAGPAAEAAGTHKAHRMHNKPFVTLMSRRSPFHTTFRTVAVGAHDLADLCYDNSTVG
jgi:hypothetical protein